MLHSTHTDEPRFIQLIDAAIARKEVDLLPAWTKEKKDVEGQKKRKRVGEKEAKEAEESAKEMGVWEEFYGSGKETEKKRGKKGGKKVSNASLIIVTECWWFGWSWVGREEEGWDGGRETSTRTRPSLVSLSLTPFLPSTPTTSFRPPRPSFIRAESPFPFLPLTSFPLLLQDANEEAADEEDTSSLQALIQRNAAKRSDSFLSSMEAKYGPGGSASKASTKKDGKGKKKVEVEEEGHAAPEVRFRSSFIPSFVGLLLLDSY